MVVYNTTGSLGVMLQYMTLNITGSLFLTFLMIMGVLLAILLAFKVPFELSIPLMFPLLIVYAIIDKAFFGILGLVLIMASLFLINKLFLNK